MLYSQCGRAESISWQVALKYDFHTKYQVKKAFCMKGSHSQYSLTKAQAYIKYYQLCREIKSIQKKQKKTGMDMYKWK